MTNCCHHIDTIPIISGDQRLNVALLENSYPPRYEDALKLPAATPRDFETIEDNGRRLSNRNLNDPPPFYENNEQLLSLEIVDERIQTENHCKFLFYTINQKIVPTF